MFIKFLQYKSISADYQESLFNQKIAFYLTNIKNDFYTGRFPWIIRNSTATKAITSKT